MKRVAKWTFGVLAILVLLIASGLLAVWLQPALLINDRVARWAIERFVGATVRYRELHVAAISESFWVKRFTVSAAGLCLIPRDPQPKPSCLERVSLAGRASLRRGEPFLTAEADALGSFNGIEGTLATRARWNGAAADGTFVARLGSLPGPFPGVRLTSGTYKVTPPFGSPRVELGLRAIPFDVADVEPWRFLEWRGGAALAVDATVDPNRRATGKVRLNVDPFLRDAASMAQVELGFDAKLTEPPATWKIDGNAGVTLSRFEELVRVLRRTPMAIPEPLQSLTGEIRIEAVAKGSVPEIAARLPWKVVTRLGSESQKLDLDVEGTFAMPPKQSGQPPQLQAAVTLSDVQLVLPHLEFGKLPRLAPDGRIVAQESIRKLAAKGPAMQWKVSVKTPPERPVRLKSNLVEEAVPIALSLDMASDAALDGRIYIQSFPLEMFRRRATVRYISLHPERSSKQIELRGEIFTRHADYRIRILLLGLASAPQVRMVSDPPLPEDEIVAVLLFGRRLNELGSGDIESVGSARAAIADGAVGLASMYLLASTPVERIGYDPTSGTFSAKVRLGDGTSLAIGANRRSVGQLGVRHRLAENWAVATYLENPFENVRRSLTAFLEWTFGY